MPRLTPLESEQASEAGQKIFDSIKKSLGMVPNIFRAMGHAPEVLEAVLALDGAIQKHLPGKFRELAYLKTSMINQCDY